MDIYTTKWNRTFWQDLGERVAATFIGALLATLVLVEGTKVDWTDAQAVWTVLGVPTLVSLLKGLAMNLKDPNSGASAVSYEPYVVLEPDKQDLGEF